MVHIKPALTWWNSRAERVIAFFVPSSMTDDPLASKQALMFVASHLLGPFLGISIPLALWVFDPTPGWDILVLAASITSFWAFPLLLRWGVPFPALVFLSITLDNFVILWSCYFHGGVASPTLIWILIVPILAIFYVGDERKLQSYLMAVSALSCLIFILTYLTLDAPPSDVPPKALMGLGVISTLAVLCYVAGMAVYYARIFDASVELEAEVKHRQALSAELRQAVAAANRASAARSQFLVRMSHELRSPINAILGYGQLLKQEAEDIGRVDLFARDVDRILDAGYYLVRLIDKILDLSKIEAGRMQLDARPRNIERLVQDTVERSRAMIEASGNRIELDIAPNLGMATIDEKRLYDILEGLLSNAAQHTRDGVITVSCRCNDADGFFYVEVEDTGDGMPPEVLASVFETFATPREAGGGRYGGTGLSLAVNARFCAAMGGRITARSAPGEGSVFTVTLPVAPPGTERAAAMPAIDAKLGLSNPWSVNTAGT